MNGPLPIRPPPDAPALAILGGSVMPPLQGAIIDLETVSLSGVSFPAVRASFALVVACFAVIAHYGRRTATASRPAALDGAAHRPTNLW